MSELMILLAVKLQRKSSSYNKLGMPSLPKIGHSFQATAQMKIKDNVHYNFKHKREINLVINKFR